VCYEKVVAKMKKVVFWVAKMKGVAGDALRGYNLFYKEKVKLQLYPDEHKLRAFSHLHSTL
jgi:hypothetical protein